MASYSAVSHLPIRKQSEETNPAVAVENKEINNELSAQIDELSQDVSSLTEQPHNINQTISTILLKLNEICHDLTTREHYSTSLAFVIFNKILKIYIQILDLHQFVDAILHYDPKRHVHLLRKLLDIENHYDFDKLIQQMSLRVQRELFFSLFKQLDSSAKLISYLQNNLNTNLDPDRILINSCSSVLYTMLKVLNRIQITITDNDLEKYQNPVLTSIIRFMNDYFKNKEHLRVNEKNNKKLMKQILLFIANLTVKILTLRIFINIDYPQICLSWLSLSYLNATGYLLIISTLKDIACHDDGVIVLNKLNCAKIVHQFKNEALHVHVDFIIDKNMRELVSQMLDLILVLIVDPDVLFVEEVNSDAINQVLSTTINTSASLIFRNKWLHLSELLIGLMKLCANDNILDFILQKNGCLGFFLTTLRTLLSDIGKKNIDDVDIGLEVLAIMALGNILWSISFHDGYKNDLIQNIDLIKLLEELRESYTLNYTLAYIYIPQQMSSLKRTADGILHNLYLLLPSKLENQFNSNRKMTCSLTISYSHVNIDFCRQLYDILNAIPKLSISVDFNTGKYLWKDIVETLAQADVVVFLLSKDFFYDKSCRQELIYVTDKLKKLFIPIFIDRDFKPTGWLHKRIARLKSIRFDKTNLIGTCEELLSMINEHLYMNISLVRNSLDIKQWSDKEVKEWFMKNDILPELDEFYQFRNGNELLLYAKAILAYPWINEYERIRTRFAEKFQQKNQNLTQEQFLQFINQLQILNKQVYFN
ncbi:unnamed protein product [Rotaria socialis]|uniref:TIR domain-containing protein n=1 Tax=Rotaria socialis TaxID=392032 RepID=A0A818E0A6_9BILA|nr:unnamed protein product [Rotaria socialis]CAF4438464.1 unnamed protein product [Rotaria socialis]